MQADQRPRRGRETDCRQNAAADVWPALIPLNFSDRTVGARQRNAARGRTLQWPLSSASDAEDEEQAIQIQRIRTRVIGASAATPKVSYRPRRRRRSACAEAETDGTRMTTRTWPE